MAEPPSKRMYFSPVAPSPDPGAHELVIRFDADGGIGFEAATDSPSVLAAKLRRLVFDTLPQMPQILDKAAGLNSPEINAWFAERRRHPGVSEGAG